jgi:serine/threonine-protein kinase
MSIVDTFLNWHLWAVKGYRLRGKIASGGMSTIYKAASRATHETVAIKILFPHYAKHRAMLQKLFKENQVEGEIASNLQHRNVVRTYSFGRIKDRCYFVMEYVDGMNLNRIIYYKSELLRSHRLDIIKQAADGLNYIHSQGIIHRDFCPKNILLSRDGEVKIIDFGLAVSKTSRFKGLGERSGTPSYMAPEQIRALEADERTDIYGFGVSIYEMFAGRPPFAGEDSFARMQHHLSSEPVPLSKRVPDIQPAVEEIVSRAMQKDPGDRYKSMDELLKDLREIE